MASKADRRAIAILSVCDGALRVIRKEKRFSQVKIQDHVKAGETYIGYVRDNYSKNYTEHDVKITLRNLDAWGRELDKFIPTDELHTRVLVKIGIMGISDLLDVVRNPIRVEWLTNIYDNMQVLDDMIDPEGTAFLSMEQADEILSALYRNIT